MVLEVIHLKEVQNGLNYGLIIYFKKLKKKIGI